MRQKAADPVNRFADLSAKIFDITAILSMASPLLKARLKLGKGDLLKSDRLRRHSDTVTRAILCYWIKCPDAKDTIEGIRKWWIPGGHAVGEEQVQKTLDFLISKAWVTRRETTPSKTIYSINKDHLENIKRYLARS